jgi:hypothetical protein
MRVRHPAIAGLLDCGAWEGQPYLAYDFVDGLSLDRWRARQTRVTQRQAAEFVRQLAEAVQVAHNAGVVHRDIKPTNILIDKGGAIHITDFGLAAALTRRGSAEPVGSLGFAAPEQLRADVGCEDALVDVYALGGLLFWLITARFPNGSSPEEVHARLEAWDRPGPPDPRRDAPSLDPTLAAICRRALAPLAHERYPSAAVLALDLAKWLAREPVAGIDRTPGRRLRLWVRRSPWVAAGTGVALAALAGALGLAWKADLARRQASLQAELDMTLVREQEKQLRLEEANAYLTDTLSAMASVSAEAADYSWLPVLSALEAIGGDRGIGLAHVGSNINTMRIDVANNLLDEADAKGARDTAESVVWEMTLAFWLLKDARASEALAVLEANRARSERVLRDGDPWRRDIAALFDIATILSTSGGNDAAAARLREVVDDLPPNIRKLARDALKAGGRPEHADAEPPIEPAGATPGRDAGPASQLP